MPAGRFPSMLLAQIKKEKLRLYTSSGDRIDLTADISTALPKTSCKSGICYFKAFEFRAFASLKGEDRLKVFDAKHQNVTVHPWFPYPEKDSNRVEKIIVWKKGRPIKKPSLDHFQNLGDNLIKLLDGSDPDAVNDDMKKSIFNLFFMSAIGNFY